MAGKPKYVTDMEAVYGEASSAGFGSAVFYRKLDADADLEKAALDAYRTFVGELWERWGEEAWMTPWRQVYARTTTPTEGIVSELTAVQDVEARQSIPMILDVVSDPEGAKAALATAYDAPDVTELRVYNLGDGGAMSGILLAGRRGASGETIFLVFLLD